MNILKFTLGLLGLLALQFIVLNNLQINSYIFLYTYVMWILLLPKSAPHWLMVLSGFILGLIVDFYMNTYGIHAFATTFVGYFRNKVLDPLLAKETGVEEGVPSVHNMGFQKHFIYLGILILCHNLLISFIEVFSIKWFFSTLFSAVISSFFTLIIVLIIEYIFIKKSN